MTCRQSPRGDIFTVGDCKDMDSMDHLPELVDNDPAYSSNFEQWDTYWEDLTKYTHLASCDIWGTKEVDFLGLDDFSSPYQDEEVIGRTPTLAQLNSEDSQPVCDTLYHPDLLVGQKQLLFPPQTMAKKPNKLCSSATSASSSRNPLPDFAEGSQKATWPVASSTDTMAKAQLQGPSKASSALLDNMDYVRKAKVRISVPRKPFVESSTQISVSASHLIQEHESSASQVSEDPVIVAANTASSINSEKRAETPKREVQTSPGPEIGTLRTVPQKLHFPAAAGSETLLTVSALGSDASAADKKKKEEEHNYSLFLTRARLAGKATADMEEEEEEEEEEGEEEDEEEEAEGLDLDDEDHDEDHDEGFGSEHELSENEEDDEEDEDEDYEGDKDISDVSDAFSEPGAKLHVFLMLLKILVSIHAVLYIQNTKHQTFGGTKLNAAKRVHSTFITNRPTTE